MSKYIFKEPSKLTGWEKEITIVAFGYGAIKIGTASWPDNQHMLILCDTEKSHKIASHDKDPDSEFFRDAAEVIGLGFNDPQSVDVMIEQLNEIKKCMTAFIPSAQESRAELDRRGK